MNYWERRQAEDAYEAFDEAEKVAKTIARYYASASAYLIRQAGRIFDKFRRKYHLTEEEAKVLLSSMVKRDDLNEMVNRLRAMTDRKEKEELRREIEAHAYRARLARLYEMQEQVGTLMKQVYRKELETSTEFYEQLARESFLKEIFRTQQRANAGFAFGMIDRKTMDRVIRSRWSGKNYSERIWSNTQQLADTMKQEVLLSFLTGKSERDIAATIRHRFQVGSYEARRLVRTESNFIRTEMDFEAYKEAGVDEYQFLATLDLRTSKICRSLDGKIFKVSERKTGENCPPMHPWCRSTTISVIDRELLDTMQRAAIDPKTGERIMVPRTMTYHEWHEKYVKGIPAAEMKETGARNLSNDKEQFERYRNVLGNMVPTSLDEFQEMKYTQKEKWNQIKHNYRIVNSYEINAGSMTPEDILRLDEVAYNGKKKLFTGKAKRRANIGVMELDGHLYYANSRVTEATDPEYNNFRGDKDDLVLMKPDGERRFETKEIGHDRKVDTEAKLLEFAADLAKDGKEHIINLLSERCMCESCTGVLKQFQERYPNVVVNVVSGRSDRVEKNHNNPWRYR